MFKGTCCPSRGPASQSVSSQHRELQLRELVECRFWLPCAHLVMQTSYTHKVKGSKPLKNTHFPQLGSMYKISKWVQLTCWHWRVDSELLSSEDPGTVLSTHWSFTVTAVLRGQIPSCLQGQQKPLCTSIHTCKMPIYLKNYGDFEKAGELLERELDG